jgi:hypothetical protein
MSAIIVVRLSKGRAVLTGGRLALCRRCSLYQRPTQVRITMPTSAATANHATED